MSKLNWTLKEIFEDKVQFYFWLEEIFMDISWYFGDKARKIQDDAFIKEWNQSDVPYKIIKRL